MQEQGTTCFYGTICIGVAGLILNSCNFFKEEEVASHIPLGGQNFRTNGMHEYLSNARAARGRLFMARNATKPGVGEKPSGLQFLVLREGSGSRPRLSDTVITHYKLHTTQGLLIDDSMDYGEPQEFEIDKVIAGWREALQEMKVGAKWKLFVPPELAYGAHGLAQILGGQTLVYELTLLGIKANSDSVPVVLPAKPVDGDVAGGVRLFPDAGAKVPVGDQSRDNLDLLD
jgi:FKBP-type peptidyl-prolyl cis-trans isomerase